MKRKKNPTRLETGYVRCPDDWEGVFIRGDNAGYFGNCLQDLIRLLEEASGTEELPEKLRSRIQFVLNFQGMRGLVKLLCGTVSKPDEVQEIDLMENWIKSPKESLIKEE